MVRRYSQNNSLLYYVDTASPMLMTEVAKINFFVKDSLHLNQKGMSYGAVKVKPIFMIYINKMNI
ncbi:MAG: hypothetical protein CM15mP106_8270 [Candidatus Neomarinimicrobiota bacterium]|nr:MAG: hypothetical protein CM15mP106_8270 [Candidatus Neomarinimicrobiota bacterium]